MATLFSDVITQYAMQFIDDVRWQEQLALNPAQFFRAKSQALIASVPRFNRPPTIQSFLIYDEPSYEDFTYTVKEEDTFPLTLDTGAKEYDLCSVGTVTVDNGGGATYTPIHEYEYVDKTGEVVINTEVPVGTEIDIDFYTDGEFKNNLDATQLRIMGLCIAYDWYYRMENAFLNVLNPITDKTFSPRSATADDKRSNTARFKELGLQLSSELMAYEQRLYALKYIPNNEWNNLITTTNATPSKSAERVSVEGNTIYITSRNIDVKGRTVHTD